MRARYHTRDKEILWSGIKLMINSSSKFVNNIRAIAATMIAEAGSGHTGISLGAAPIFYSVYNDSLKYFPMAPDHPNRDRFVLDSGHASALLYATLYAYGYKYTKKDIMNFRRIGSNTPGHPSLNPKLGVDASSGPLGQGIPMAVGLAIAEKKLAARFNKADAKIVDHYTFCFAGDGGMMEGITNEASSLAGTLGLNKLIVLYDSNNITIEGETGLAFTENVLMRYRALGWNTIEVNDGENTDSISAAISVAKQSKTKPTIIKINTAIGFGTPYMGDAKIHGMALNPKDLAVTVANLGVKAGKFEFEKEVKEQLKSVVERHNLSLNQEIQQEKEYKKKYPAEYIEYTKWLADGYSMLFDAKQIKAQTEPEETRSSGAEILKIMAAQIPNLVVGSADLAPSTKVQLPGGGDFSRTNPLGRNIHFGVREHAMGAIMNGIALHGGFRVACSTFMVFSDYMRHAIRLSALMQLPVIYVLTHDSIAVGEDGKTHQPVEYASMYRSTPGIVYFRPADRAETIEGFRIAIKAKHPTILALTRQKTEYHPNLTGTNAALGAYPVMEFGLNPDVVIYATGSELALARRVAVSLKLKGASVNLVSVPSVEIFQQQPKDYREKIMNRGAVVRVAIEASTDPIWYKFVGMDGCVFNLDDFGFTATAEEVYAHFGLTPEKIEQAIIEKLKHS